LASLTTKNSSFSEALAQCAARYTTARTGILDGWKKAALVKEFFLQYRIKFDQEDTHITSITLDRKGKASGNVYFHAGECYQLMMAVARGPSNRVNFDNDLITTTGDVWVDKVTGNRLKGNFGQDIGVLN